MQKIIKGEGSLSKLEEFLSSIASEKFLLVCGSAFDFLDVRSFFENPALNFVRFSDFTPNPQYDDVAKGVEIFNKAFRQISDEKLHYPCLCRLLQYSFP